MVRGFGDTGRNYVVRLFVQLDLMAAIAEIKFRKHSSKFACPHICELQLAIFVLVEVDGWRYKKERQTTSTLTR